jgi:hypothetical protein
VKKIALALVSCLLLGGTSPALADSCVSSSEFSRLRTGMTEVQVKNLTGTNGTVFTAAGSGQYRIVIRSYKACTKYGAVSISFMGGKLQSKSGVF